MDTLTWAHITSLPTVHNRPGGMVFFICEHCEHEHGHSGVTIPGAIIRNVTYLRCNNSGMVATGEDYVTPTLNCITPEWLRVIF